MNPMAAPSSIPLQTLDVKPISSFSPTRKRRAASPVNTKPSSQVDDPVVTFAHRNKRHRPNLANGFQGLSISTDRLQSDENHARSPSESPIGSDKHDEGIGLSTIGDPNELKIEVLTEETPNKLHHHHHHSNRYHWSIPNYAGPSSSSSTSPTSSLDDTNYDSDVTHTRPFNRRRKYDDVAQQADEIVQPEEMTSPDAAFDVAVEDVTVQNRRRRQEDSENRARAKRARTMDDNDIDMDQVGTGRDLDGVTRNQGSRKQTIWHEPEKDRIVITSLSDTSSSASSRSPSPEADNSQERHLSQPGTHGFTLSPSLLTHLLKSQRNYLQNDLRSNQNHNSLILYRPLGIGSDDEADPIVRTWQPDEAYADSGRFEAIDDDENLEETPEVQMDVDGDVEMV